MIDTFDDEYFFLSNYFPSYVLFEEGVYNSAEAAFQAAKTTDRRLRYRFMGVKAGEAKRLGRMVELRPDWEDVKYDIMKQVVHNKFCEPELQDALLSTGDEELVEGNTWHDNIWGDCRCKKCKNIPGQNWLGQILMEVREEFKNLLL